MPSAANRNTAGQPKSRRRRYSERAAVAAVRVLLEGRVERPRNAARALVSRFVTDNIPRRVVAKKAATKVAFRRGCIRRATVQSVHFLNWKSALGAGASTIVALATVNQPWVLALSCLAVAAQFYPSFTRSVGARHAVVLWALWSRGGGANRVPDAAILPLVNRTLLKDGSSKMSMRELRSVLEDLEELRCAEQTLTGWRVVTRVKVTG